MMRCVEKCARDVPHHAVRENFITQLVSQPLQPSCENACSHLGLSADGIQVKRARTVLPSCSSLP
jgi:hypothetical protein